MGSRNEPLTSFHALKWVVELDQFYKKYPSRLIEAQHRGLRKRYQNTYSAYVELLWQQGDLGARAPSCCIQEFLYIMQHYKDLF